MSESRRPARGDPEPILRASEVGHYSYCHRAWWLHAVRGVPLENVAELAAGTEGHRAHGRQVLRARLLQWLAIAALVLAVALAVLWLASQAGA